MTDTMATGQHDHDLEGSPLGFAERMDGSAASDELRDTLEAPLTGSPSDDAVQAAGGSPAPSAAAIEQAFGKHDASAVRTQP